jgi:hypothetical protein
LAVNLTSKIRRCGPHRPTRSMPLPATSHRPLPRPWRRRCRWHR